MRNEFLYKYHLLSQFVSLNDEVVRMQSFFNHVKLDLQVCNASTITLGYLKLCDVTNSKFYKTEAGGQSV